MADFSMLATQHVNGKRAQKVDDNRFFFFFVHHPSGTGFLSNEKKFPHICDLATGDQTRALRGDACDLQLWPRRCSGTISVFENESI